MRRLALAAAAFCALLPSTSNATITLLSSTPYAQSFDTLPATGANNGWTNNTTLAGWYLFRQPAPGTAVTSIAAGDGGSNAGGFYAFGSAGSSDRALGGLGSGGTYFGNPVSGAVAGWVAAAFVNGTGAALTGFRLSFDGEQWRNGGNTTAQTMVFEYGFGANFGAVTTWTAPGGSFDWTSPVAASAASVVDGNSTGRVAGLGGLVSVSWNAGDTLWLRWTERNDTGNDHGLAIDSFSLTPVPEPSTTALMAIGGLMLAAGLRRSARRS